MGMRTGMQDMLWKEQLKKLPSNPKSARKKHEQYGRAQWQKDQSKFMLSLRHDY